jgi:predicted GNAT family N-acyltransferase
MNSLQIKEADYLTNKEIINQIRVKVFQEEQGVAEKLEFDGLDATAIHLLAYLDNKAVGTTRIRAIDCQTAKIERLAVLLQARGQGIGKKIMEAAIEIATIQDYQTIIIHAQEYIKNLYLQLGFEQIGNTFVEADIAHIKMIKTITKYSQKYRDN